MIASQSLGIAAAKVFATYQLTPGWKLANILMRALLRTGFQLGSTYLLTVKGRKSGRLLTTPVTLVEEKMIHVS